MRPSIYGGSASKARKTVAWRVWRARSADGLLILVGFMSAYYVRYQLQWFRTVDPANQLDLWDYLPFALILVVLILFSGSDPT